MNEDDVLPLRIGSRGRAVADLTARLERLGFAVGDDSESFCETTAVAVTEFQRLRGLWADGVCGNATWAALVEAGWRLGDRLLYLTRPMLRGDDVADLQRRLGSLGFDAGRVDGIFGPDTVRALSDFQRNAGLTSDAICGPEVVAALRRLNRTSVAEPVVGIRELEALRSRPKTLLNARIAVGENGACAPLVEATVRQLSSEGADVLPIHHPSDSHLATQANTWDADAFIAVRVDATPGLEVAYYGRPNYESIGGKRLAEEIHRSVLTTLSGNEEVGSEWGRHSPAPRPMTVPALRETRMPAVVIQIGEPQMVVRSAPQIAQAISAAVSRWALEPAPGSA